MLFFFHPQKALLKARLSAADLKNNAVGVGRRIGRDEISEKGKHNGKQDQRQTGEGRLVAPQPFPGSLPERKRGLVRSEEHTSELQSRLHLVCRLLLEKKKKTKKKI